MSNYLIVPTAHTAVTAGARVLSLRGGLEADDTAGVVLAAHTLPTVDGSRTTITVRPHDSAETGVATITRDYVMGDYWTEPVLIPVEVDDVDPAECAHYATRDYAHPNVDGTVTRGTRCVACGRHDVVVEEEFAVDCDSCDAVAVRTIADRFGEPVRQCADCLDGMTLEMREAADDLATAMAAIVAPAVVVTVTIGRNVPNTAMGDDDEMTAARWEEFQRHTGEALDASIVDRARTVLVATVHTGVGEWQGEPEESAVVTRVLTGHDALDARGLVRRVARLREEFGQDAIAVAAGPSYLV